MARPQASGLGGDSLTQRAAELLDRRERVGRRGSALARMARELADARRQIATLQRENGGLKAQLANRATARRGAPRTFSLVSAVVAPPDEHD